MEDCTKVLTKAAQQIICTGNYNFIMVLWVCLFVELSNVKQGSRSQEGSRSRDRSWDRFFCDLDLYLGSYALSRSLTVLSSVL